jgi:hypothetical protein
MKPSSCIGNMKLSCCTARSSAGYSLTPTITPCTGSNLALGTTRYSFVSSDDRNGPLTCTVACAGRLSDFFFL